MRQVKFKGKTVEGKWLFGDLVQWKSKGICAILPQDGSQWSNPYDFEVIPETVGQFTGLLDKNGNEIYEGDIIKTTSELIKMFSGERTGRYASSEFIIDWQNDYSRFNKKRISDNEFENLGTTKENYAKFGEIIGNIHDK